MKFLGKDGTACLVSRKWLLTDQDAIGMTTLVLLHSPMLPLFHVTSSEDIPGTQASPHVLLFNLKCGPCPVLICAWILQ